MLLWDTVRADLRFFVNGLDGHPGEAKARNVSSNPLVDAAGIHSYKDAFGKVSQTVSGHMSHGLLNHTSFAAVKWCMASKAGRASCQKTLMYRLESVLSLLAYF